MSIRNQILQGPWEDWEVCEMLCYSSRVIVISGAAADEIYTESWSQFNTWEWTAAPRGNELLYGTTGQWAPCMGPGSNELPVWDHGAITTNCDPGKQITSYQVPEWDLSTYICLKTAPSLSVVKQVCIHPKVFQTKIKWKTILILPYICNAAIYCIIYLKKNIIANKNKTLISSPPNISFGIAIVLGQVVPLLYLLLMMFQYTQHETPCDGDPVIAWAQARRNSQHRVRSAVQPMLIRNVQLETMAVFEIKTHYLLTVHYICTRSHTQTWTCSYTYIIILHQFTIDLLLTGP